MLVGHPSTTMRGSGSTMRASDALVRYAYFIAGDLPTQKQRENFVDFVSHAHSWYKHVSPYPPGTRFYFFLNKYAGHERRHGTVEVKERTQVLASKDQIAAAPGKGVLIYGLPVEILDAGTTRLTAHCAGRRGPIRVPRTHGETRRAVLRRFPHAIYFRVDGNSVVMLSIHGRQHPSNWQGRS